MSEVRVDVKVWGAVVAAVRDLRVETERAFAVEPVDLVGLYRKACLRLDRLRSTLEQSMKPPEAAGLLEPLCILVDERVLACLGDGSIRRRLEWPLLQRPFRPQAFGGDLFFETVAELAAQPSPSVPRVQMYLFCLSEGFVGCCADDPSKLQRYKEQLWSKLGPQDQPSAVITVARPTPAPVVPWQQIALAAVLVLAWQGLWWALEGGA